MLLKNLRQHARNIDRLNLNALRRRHTTHLEQVDQHARESSYLASKVPNNAGIARVHGRRPFFQQLCDTGDGGDRRTQFVAHIRGETLFAGDASLHRIGHVVEGIGDRVEVRITRRRKPNIEIAGSQRAGAVTELVDRNEQATYGVPAEQSAESAGEDRHDHQAPPTDDEGTVECAQREDLDEKAPRGRQADHQVGIASHIDALLSAFNLSLSQQIGRERVRRDRHGRGEPGTADPQHRL